MKLLKETHEKYYLEDGEAEKIKAAIRMDDLAAELEISYQHLWRKMTKAPKHYFERNEVIKIQYLTGIVFNIH